MLNMLWVGVCFVNVPQQMADWLDLGYLGDRLLEVILVLPCRDHSRVKSTRTPVPQYRELLEEFWRAGGVLATLLGYERPTVNRCPRKIHQHTKAGGIWLVI